MNRNYYIIGMTMICVFVLAACATHNNVLDSNQAPPARHEKSGAEDYMQIAPEKWVAEIEVKYPMEFGRILKTVVVPKSPWPRRQTPEYTAAYNLWYARAYAVSFLNGCLYVRNSIDRTQQPLDFQGKVDGWFDGSAKGRQALEQKQYEDYMRELREKYGKSKGGNP